MTPQNIKNLYFSREMDPFPPTLLAGGVGWRVQKMHNFRAFLALRQLPGLAEGVGCRCGSDILSPIRPLPKSGRQNARPIGKIRPVSMHTGNSNVPA
jgi:hypothetical protein